MRRFDLSPLMRSSIGFDHLSRLVDAASSGDASPSYPPYNIEKLGEDDYRIQMAVAGFRPEELDVIVEDQTLTISARAEEEAEERVFLHRGIAKRAFERRFELADTIKVGEAKMAHGFLEVDLKRVIPEHKKPRRVAIKSEAAAGEQELKTIDGNAA